MSLAPQIFEHDHAASPRGYEETDNAILKHGIFGRDRWQFEADEPEDFAPWPEEEQPYERLRRRRQTDAGAADGGIVTSGGARQHREGGKIRTEFPKEMPKEKSPLDAVEQNMQGIYGNLGEGALLP